MKIGLLGCGAIGKTIAHAIEKGKAGKVELKFLCDIDKEKINNLKKELKIKDIFTTEDIEDIIEDDEIDLIIEAASQGTLKLVAEKVLNGKKNLMVMSVGALSDNCFLKKIEYCAKKNNVKVYIPSGAVSGIDGVKSASIETLHSVELRSTKNPKSLIGQPYLVENGINISNLEKPMIVFQGNAKDAAKGFPKSVNVAVALALAGIGVEETKVTLVADPKATRTQHEIIVKGAFGDMYSSVKNILHPDNPRTSYLAALAAIRTIKKMTETIQIGT